jgi:hypothetical protein
MFVAKGLKVKNVKNPFLTIIHEINTLDKLRYIRYS